MSSDEEAALGTSTPKDKEISVDHDGERHIPYDEVALEDSELATSWTTRRKLTTFVTIWIFTLCR